MKPRSDHDKDHAHEPINSDESDEQVNLCQQCGPLRSPSAEELAAVESLEDLRRSGEKGAFGRRADGLATPVQDPTHALPWQANSSTPTQVTLHCPRATALDSLGSCRPDESST